jgi:hypothetical protein
MEMLLNLTPLDLLIMAEARWHSIGCIYLSNQPISNQK